MSNAEKAPSSSFLPHLLGLSFALAVGLGIHLFYPRDMGGGGETQRSQWQLGLGLAGGAMVWLLIFLPLRRRLQKRLSGRFEPWMITHSWLGVGATLLLLHHADFHFSFDLRGILLGCLLLSVLLGVVLLLLRQKQSWSGSEATASPSPHVAKLVTYHRLFSVLTGALLAFHVLFDAVIR